MAASNLLKFAVAYDGSESSVASLNAMVKHSLFAAAPERVEVHLISCVPPVNTYPPFGMPIESAEAIMTERLAEATRMLQEAQARVQAAGGEHVKLHVEVGDARIVLTRICTEQQADHLYLGTRGYSNITGFFLGSVTQYCVHHTKCPVTITH